jgi:hypothetical protein
LFVLAVGEKLTRVDVLATVIIVVGIAISSVSTHAIGQLLVLYKAFSDRWLVITGVWRALREQQAICCTFHLFSGGFLTERVGASTVCHVHDGQVG